VTRVEEARRSFEESWHGLKGSVDKQVGLRPLSGLSRPGRGWVVGAVALAAGLALGLSLRGRFRRRSGTKKRR
jgi:hypothetical protein